MSGQAGFPRQVRAAFAARQPGAVLLVVATVFALGTAAPGAGEWPKISLVRVWRGFSRPVHIIHAGDGSGRLFIVEQAGCIRVSRDGALLPVPFLDIVSRVSCCGERGLLSVAFPPGYGSKRYFYVDYTDTGGSWQSAQLLDGSFAVSTFGEDEAGTIYMPDYNAGDVYKLTDPAVTAGYTYRVPAVAHTIGAGGTRWRTDVAVANRSGLTATFSVAYTSRDLQLTQLASLGPGGTAGWRNVLESLFGLAPTGNSAGLLEVVSDAPLAATARSYSDGPQGTMGQDLRALPDSDALLPGRVGVLPQLRRGGGFYTNLGVVNLGAAVGTVEVKVFDIIGSQVGSTRLFTVEGGRWVPQYDFLASVGAGNQDTAYATVEVVTPEGKAWAYAALIDSLTRDPTTIALVTP